MGEEDIRDARRRQWRELLAEPASAEEEGDDGVSRRAFVRRMAASLGLAGLTAACTRTEVQSIHPYVNQPRDLTPGVPQRYATSLVLNGYATGLVVESREGRPTKIEGNPAHPDSLGATSVWGQALVLGVYDPSRARSPSRHGVPTTWGLFASDHLTTRVGAPSGERLHFLLEPTSSPLLVSLIGRVRARRPKASFHFYSPASRDRVWQGARIAFGEPLEQQLDLGAARVILAIDGDLLDTRPGHLRYARQLANGRRLPEASSPMNRLYVAEAGVSVTGASADHRLAVRDHDLPALAAALAAKVVAGGSAPEDAKALAAAHPKLEAHARWIDAVARDLLANRGASAVLVGDAMPPEVHALGHLMNEALGNHGKVVTFTVPPIFEAGQPSHGLSPLVSALDAGEVDTLVILGGNPAYTAYADAEFSSKMTRARSAIYLGPYRNETALRAGWFVPEAHELESWGDARSVDGTISMVQPLIDPLFGGRTASEVLALFAGAIGVSGRALLERYHREAYAGGDFDASYRQALARGVVEGTALPRVHRAIAWTSLGRALTKASAPASKDPSRLPTKTPDPSAVPTPRPIELRFRLDPRVYDGRFTNNGWLLELPEPISTLTWDNAALMSPATASRLGVATESVVRIETAEGAVEAPVLLESDHADDSVTLHLGWGRQGDEELANGVGVNAYALRASSAPFVTVAGFTEVRDRSYELALAQLDDRLHGREEDIYFHASLDEYRKDPGFTKAKNKAPLRLYQNKPAAPVQWGMVVDLTTCIGCGVCVVACQAENNVPVVGKLSVHKGRIMHWLRIDRYVLDTPGGRHLGPQPMLCQHCEMAPCEYVCPVNATVHSDDGLNQMVYNRCVGTRFCSNNCPYKVRRFNWFDYNADLGPLEQLQKNPEVTVRQRGVMEKCSFCVQRIRTAGIRSRVERRALRDGEIETACQQACPTKAIVFGDINDPDSAVSRLRRIDRLYAALQNVGTLPRVRYLAKILNLNPELVG